jgi:nucleotide-binding universal stress UspA family protein
VHKHILIATDGSQIAASAVDRGLELASQLSARITLLTVTEFWSALEVAASAQAGSQNPVADYENLAQQHAQKILAAGAEKARAAGVACEAVYVPDSRPAEAIVEEAKARGCDLIVMGSHGRRGIDRLIIGSQTARVLALTSTPVLVYR